MKKRECAASVSSFTLPSFQRNGKKGRGKRKREGRAPFIITTLLFGKEKGAVKEEWREFPIPPYRTGLRHPANLGKKK